MTNLSRKQRRLDRALTYWEDMAGEISAEKLHTLNDQRTQLYKTLTSGLQDAVFVERSAELLTNLYPLGERGGYLKEWIPLLRQTYQALPSDNQLICQLLNQLAYSLFRENDLDEADRVLKQIQNYPCDEFQQSLHQFYKALVLVKRVHLEQAITQLNLSIINFRRLGDSAIQKLGSACMANAYTHRRLGHYDLAIKLCMEAIDAYHTVQDVSYEARAHFTLSGTYRCTNQLELGLQALDKAEILLSNSINKPDLAHLWNERGVIYLVQKRWQKAIDALRKIDVAFLEENGDTDLIALCSYNLAYSLNKVHRHTEAITILKKVEPMWIELDDQIMLAMNTSLLAEATLLTDSVESGWPMWEKANLILAQVTQTETITQRRTELQQLPDNWFREHTCD